MVGFKYLVRFEDEDSHVQYGEASAEASHSDMTGPSLDNYKGAGEPWQENVRLSEKKATVSRVCYFIPVETLMRHD